jgi:hypothetical protein
MMPRSGTLRGDAQRSAALRQEVQRPPAPGPIFVLGRQHSGNTMLALILGRLQNVYSQLGESHFFEHLARLGVMGSVAGLPALAKLVADAAQPKLATADVLELAVLEQSKAEVSNARRWDPALVFDRVMSALAGRAGKTRWAQKATSHIFYSAEIELRLPNSKQIFLIRNPFDIAASLKRRNQSRQILRAAWAWNRGVAIALARSQQRPDCFLLVRYEDMIMEPAQTLEIVCRFIGERSSEELLDVPHVNRSERPYELSSERRGIQSDRLWVFDDVLSQAERKIVARYIEQQSAETLYPELAARGVFRAKAAWIRTLPAVSAALWDLGVHHARMMRNDPYVVIQRVIKRVA